MILLDTHALVWLVTEPKHLSRDASRAIKRAYATDGIAVAAITLWELAALFAAGRLRAAGTLEAAVMRICDQSKATVIPIDVEIAALSVQLPATMPRDPADRLIVATARSKGLLLVSKDSRIGDSGACEVIW